MAIGLTAASDPLHPADRRAGTRVRPGDAGWRPNGSLRPGHALALIDVAARGVLIETTARVLPGARVDLLLGHQETRCRAAGHVRRCFVVALRPLRYRAAIALDGVLELHGASADG